MEPCIYEQERKRQGFFFVPALVIDHAEHRGPDGHEDDEEGEEEKAGNQLSFAALCITCGGAMKLTVIYTFYTSR